MKILGHEIDLDLGHDHYLAFTSWAPDPNGWNQYEGLPETNRLGAMIFHKQPDGSQCAGTIMFECDQARRVFPDKPAWKVQSWDPLTCSPSILCSCGDHGYIRDGKWVSA